MLEVLSPNGVFTNCQDEIYEFIQLDLINHFTP